MKVLVLAAALAAVSGAAWAEDVAVEEATLGKSAVKLHVQPFLTPEELTTLRLVLSNEQALQVFIGAGEGAGKGFAAMAVNPDEGFIRDGKPVKSAVALAGLKTAEEAAKAAIDGCQVAARKKAACVLVLEVATR
ncbi:hypothetical protein MASR1M32_26920 [Rhodobacter sp.]